jgi:photosystem II stability/assembly factor-like uncharacterized protein
MLAVVASASLAQWETSSGQIKAGVYTVQAMDGVLYAGTDGDGAFRSSDRGATWNPLNNGYPEGTYSFAEFGGRLFAGTYDGVYYSSDHGLNWTRSNHDNWKVLHVVALAGNGSFLFATSNQEWRYPNNGGLFRSADSGLTWTPVNKGFTATIWINTLAQHKNALYVGTSGEGAFRSSDNGNTWTPFNKGFTEGAKSNPRYFFPHDDKLYAGTGSGVYVLSTGSDAWKRISKGLQQDMLITSIVTYGNHLFAGASMGDAGGVFHSADGGASWKRITNGLDSNPLNVISLAVMGDELFASTGESVCGEMGCNGSLGTIWKVSIPRLLGLPTNSRTKPDAKQTRWQKIAVPGHEISFEVRSRSFISLKVHDATGKSVSSMVERQFAPGKYTIPFEPEGLSKGPYFIQWRAQGMNGDPIK